MHKKITYKVILFGLVTLSFILTGSILYFKYNPAEYSFFPKCSFLTFTGFKCPGCGSQRTLHALLHLDIRSAFSYNALIVLLIPYLILLFTGKIMQFFQPYSKFAFFIQHPSIIWCFFFMVILFWITRNIFGF